ncbi:MAG: polysaccharide biosynthesis C-terminal domain-containing protein [Bacteroidales bacterium]|jgi:O-antigen/teichoic acid export membrane protein|nr:polysaccharide biosynthesis C-terminal domain-containing protein [Bacteroidales bacterium]
MGIIIRQSLKGTIVNYVGAFIGFVTTMFVSTKFLTPEELGLTRVMIEAATILGGLMTLGISSSGLRFFPFFKTDKNSHNNGFLFYLLLFPTVGAIVFGLLYVCLKTGITNYFATESPLFNRFFYYVIPLSIFVAFTIAFETYATNLMRIVIPKFIREVLLRLMNIAVILLYFFGFFTLSQFIFALVAIYGIMTVLNGIYIATMGKFSLKHDSGYIEKPLKKDVRNYTGFLLLASLGGAVVTKVDMFMLSGMMGLEYTGIYSIAVYMAVIVEIPNRSLQAISSPVAAQAIKENNHDKAQELFKKVSLNQLLVGSLIFIFLWINIDTIFYYIPNSEIYRTGKYVVLFIGIAKIFDAIANFAGTLVAYSKYYYYSLFFMFFLMFVTIGLNLTFIPIYAISGAAFSTALTFVLYNILMLSFVKWKLKLHPFSMNMLKILVIIATIVLINFVLPTVGNPLVDSLYRSSILAIIAGCFVFFWNVSEDMNSVIKSFLRRDKISSL